MELLKSPTKQSVESSAIVSNLLPVDIINKSPSKQCSMIIHSGLAEARRGAEPGLAPRASGRKERLGASGLARTLCDAHARVSAAAPPCTVWM